MYGGAKNCIRWQQSGCSPCEPHGKRIRITNGFILQISIFCSILRFYGRVVVRLAGRARHNAMNYHFPGGGLLCPKTALPTGDRRPNVFPIRFCF
jgi:hypothetical protein